jgi:pimeloyl-ACP methyl ester carboxylesterase
MNAFSKSYRAIAYSRRYAAPNDRKGDVSDSTIENNAADLKGFVEKLGIAPVRLVGHSYGGFTAAFFAAEHPELVRSLVLVEPAISTLLVENASSQAQLFSLLLRSPSVALSARRFQSNSLAPSLKALDAGQNAKAVELNVDGVQDKPGAFAAMPEPVRAMMLDNARTIGELRTPFPPFKARAAKLTSKTLIVNGQDSALWLRRIGQLMLKAVPHGEAFIVPQARHFPHLENDSAFNAKVLDFFSRDA